MIVASVYLLIILFFIYKNGLFGIFIDKSISPLQFTLFFLFKSLAIPFFYYLYMVQYGGVESYDAGIFFKDSKIINSIFYESPWEYIKLLFGCENDVKGTEVFEKFISRTGNWDEGRSWRLFFNDNRSIIRIHSLIHFISFNSYYVHALISCLLGYIGIVFIYRSLKQHFISKEILLFVTFILLPGLWLFSGALLKEPIVLFNMGVIMRLTDRLFGSGYSLIRRSMYLLLIGFVIYYLKPHIGLTIFTMYFIYKLIGSFRLKFSSVWYLGSVVLVVVIINFSFLILKDVSMFTFINTKQAEFYDVAKGGIFLKDDKKFVRVNNNCLNVKYDTITKTTRINYGVPYYYWEHSHQEDTLYCISNKDTLTRYDWVYAIAPAGSGYAISDLKPNASGVVTLLHALVRSLGYPYKFPDLMNSIVTLESLFLTLCFILSIAGIYFVKDRNILLFFVLTSLLLLMLFGIATPNLGAIIRYRSVIAPFIILSVLYIINHYEAPRIRKRDN